MNRDQLEAMGEASSAGKYNRIKQLKEDFIKAKVITVASAVRKYGYSESTVIKWAKEAGVPLMNNDGKSSVVPMTDTNTPEWLKAFVNNN